MGADAGVGTGAAADTGLGAGCGAGAGAVDLAGSTRCCGITAGIAAGAGAASVVPSLVKGDQVSPSNQRSWPGDWGSAYHPGWVDVGLEVDMPDNRHAAGEA